MRIRAAFLSFGLVLLADVAIVSAAPILTLPTDISAEATGPTGAVVTFTASATPQPGTSVTAFTLTPSSGSTFALGGTTVSAFSNG